MLTGSVPASLRPLTEGIGEVAMGLAAGAGAPVAGLSSRSATSRSSDALGGVFARLAPARTNGHIEPVSAR
jgi:hypothetical protein